MILETSAIPVQDPNDPIQWDANFRFLVYTPPVNR